MKKVIFALLAALLLASPAFASVAVSEDGTYEGEAVLVNLSTGLNGMLTGSTYTVTADPVNITSAVFEGSTADAFETTLAVVDPTADQTVTLPNDTGYVMISTLATNTTTAANSVSGASNALVYEGSAADTSETSVSATNPTADRTITLPDQTGTVMLAGAATALTPGAGITLTVAPGNRLYTLTPTDNQDSTITFSGAGAAGDVVTIVFASNAAGDEIITFHATLVSSTGTLTITATAARFYTVSFISDGTHWYEIGRTAVQT